MTEAEWLAATDPATTWGFLHDKWTERRMRLYACACCRRVWSELQDERSQQAVVITERYVDGLASTEELEASANAAWEAWDHEWNGALSRGELNRLIDNFPISAAAFNVAVPYGAWGGAPAFRMPDGIVRASVTDPVAEGAVQCILLRDIFGNPFRPVAVEPDWITSTAVALARQMYEARDFSAMPILADALQDAGCDNDDILTHCRGDGPHVRGCWVVDLILGKS